MDYGRPGLPRGARPEGGSAVMTSLRTRKFTPNRQTKAAILFLFPSALVLVLFVFWPIVNSLWLSFHHWNLMEADRGFAGFANYQELMRDERFWNSVVNTVYYTLGTVPVCIALSLGLALICNVGLKGTAFFKSVYFLPVITSFAMISIIWGFLMDPDIGLLSYYMKRLGFHMPDMLRSTKWAMPAVIFVAIWKNIGFNMVILLAGLKAIPVSLYEAARLDGAGPFQRFAHITLASLRHTLLFVVIISVISSFQVFDQVYVMTRGGPLHSTETIVYYIYHQGLELLNMGYASSMAWLLFLVIFVITIVQLRIFRFDQTD